MSSDIAALSEFLNANPAPLDAEVGRFYPVPCARHGSRRWLPLLGPVHDDRDVIGFKPLHVHVDSRFVHDTYITPPWRRVPVQALGTPLSLTEYWSEDDRPLANLQFAVKRRKCRRQTMKWERVAFTLRLEHHYKGCRIGADGLCPHRGIPIATGHRLPDGSIVCAGHGLRWSAAGELLELGR